MSKIFIYFIAIVTLLALNIVFPAFRSSAPNFLFLLSILYAFRQDSPDFLWLAFFSGLMLDVYSNVFFGTYILSFMIIGLIINYTTRTFFSADPSVLYIASVVLVSNLLLIGLVYIINSVGSRFDQSISGIAADYLGKKIWLDLIWNLLFIPPVYIVTIWIDRLVNHFNRKQNTI